MAKRIAAIIFIFLCTSLAWVILGSTIMVRTDNFNRRLKGRIAASWGDVQVQYQPWATYSRPVKKVVERIVEGKKIEERTLQDIEHCIPLNGSNVKAAINLEHRKKGLLWYSTYIVDFSGDYIFVNSSNREELITFHFKFPAEHAIYDDFYILLDGKPVDVKPGTNLAEVRLPMLPKQTIRYEVGYHSQGIDLWSYRFGSEVKQITEFNLVVNTDFKEIDFPDNTMLPSKKESTQRGWRLIWHYNNLLSGFDISIQMPAKLQPGPIAGRISFFAPVSLLFFFFLIFIITTLRDVELHPMNYFFLAAAFFSFHLLLAYMVDHTSLHLAFIVSSAVSLALVISYLRLVAGIRFAAVEAGICQFVYLVLFSYAFFFKGFTGLAVTTGSVITLFLVMQMTGGIRWADRFARRPVKSTFTENA